MLELGQLFTRPVRRICPAARGNARLRSAGEGHRRRGRRVGILRSVACCAIAVIVGACTATIEPVIARNDPFTPYQEYISSHLSQGIDEGRLIYQIIGRRDRKTGTVTTLARVSIAYIGDSQRKYEIARNNRAETLPLAVITRTAGCMKKPCMYQEDFTVEIPKAALRASAAASYAFKVFARVGQEHVVDIPKSLIQSLIDGLDQPSPHRTKTADAERRS